MKAALKLLRDKPSTGTLSLDQLVPAPNGGCVTVLDALKSKHPSAEPVGGDAVCSRPPSTLYSHPILFEKIDGPLIRSVVLKMDGAAGPSGLDTAIWKRLCTSFKRFSADLCDVFSLARKLCTEYLDPEGLAPLVLPADWSPWTNALGYAPLALGNVLVASLARRSRLFFLRTFKSRWGLYSYVLVMRVDVKLQFMPSGVSSIPPRRMLF